LGGKRRGSTKRRRWEKNKQMQIWREAGEGTPSRKRGGNLSVFMHRIPREHVGRGSRLGLDCLDFRKKTLWMGGAVSQCWGCTFSVCGNKKKGYKGHYFHKKSQKRTEIVLVYKLKDPNIRFRGRPSITSVQKRLK